MRRRNRSVPILLVVALGLVLGGAAYALASETPKPSPACERAIAANNYWVQANLPEWDALMMEPLGQEFLRMQNQAEAHLRAVGQACPGQDPKVQVLPT
jgi:hypothetical protein